MAEMKGIEEESTVHIENLVGTIYFQEKHPIRLDLRRLYLALDRLFGQIRAGHDKNLKKMISDSDPLEYRPEKFDAVYIRLKEPGATVKIFGTWTITSIGCTKEEDMRRAIEIAIDLIKLALAPEETPFRPENLTIEFSNVICSSRIDQSLGCGIVQKAFPNMKINISKFSGGTYALKYPGGTIRIFGSGRILGLGFKDIEVAKKTVREVIEALNEALRKYGKEDRGDICKLERFEPTRKSIIDFAEKTAVSESVKEKAIDLIRQYCQKVTTETFGGAPESFAAAAIYIASILCVERLTQEYIADKVDITAVAIRSARDKIRDTLGIGTIL